MITKDNLDNLLDLLGFAKAGQKHSKTIGDVTLTVDRKNGEISYPEDLIVNERQTCNLSVDENFVVLECVHRLLEKGYKPANIELEPKWKIGHGASGGRADILLRDNAGKPLLLIECKTAGNEFTRAWKKTLQDGDQLFSYAQQISETQFLRLYTSDLADGALTYTSHIVAHRDNEKYLDDNPRASALGCHNRPWHKPSEIIVNIHSVMPPSCKLVRNRVYSRLLGGRNDCDERGKLDGLFERNRRSAQTQQWDAA